MSSLTDNLLDSMKIISNTIVNNTAADITVKANVVKTVDAALNIYRVKYLEGVFDVTAISGDVTYQKDDLVYLLIPCGDFSAENKLILGKVSQKKSSNTSTTIQDYKKVSDGAFTEILQGSVCSYLEDDLCELSFDKTTSVYQDFLTVVNNTRYIELDFSIKTNNLPIEQRSKGIYGIVLNLKYQVNNTELVENVSFLNNTFSGNSYYFEKLTSLSKKYKIQDGLTLIDIDSIYLISTGFPNISESKENDIYFYNINLYGISTNENDIFKIECSTSNWNFLDEEDSKQINATVYYNGLESPTYTNYAKYYWFEENSLIDTSSDYFNEYGGIGWKYLGMSNPISINRNDLFLKETHFKCISLIDEEQLETTFTLVDEKSEYDIQITVKDNTLQCAVYKNNEIYDNDNLTYSWLNELENGVVFTSESNFSSFIKNSQVSNKIDIDKTNFINYNIFKCAVSDEEDNYYGTGQIIITNQISGNNDYSVQLKNTGYSFYYNLDGSCALASMSNNNFPLIATLIDTANGEVVDTSKLTKIIWKVPNENTMIDVSSYSTENYFSSVDEFYYIEGVSELKYSSINKYNDNNINNTIKVEITYANNTYSAETDIHCIQTGQQGTNGTTDYLYPTWTNAFIKNTKPTRYFYNSVLRKSTYENMQAILSDSGDEKDLATMTENLLDGKAGYNLFTYTRENGSTLQYVQPIIGVDYLISDTTLFPYLVSGTGFDIVTYSSQGSHPSCNGLNTFELKVVDENGTDYTNDCFFDFRFNEDEVYSITYVSNNKIQVNPIEVYILSQNAEENIHIINCIIWYKNKRLASLNIPIYFRYNCYGFGGVNSWDGNSISIDGENNGLAAIYSPQLIAGEKNSTNNTFTGVLIGQVDEYVNGDIEHYNGVLGYNEGVSTFHLSAMDGSLRLGVNGGSNTIYFDPVMEAEDGTYDIISMGEDEDGNPKFSVDSNGSLTAKDGTFKGELKIGYKENAMEGPFEKYSIDENSKYRVDSAYFPTKVFIDLFDTASLLEESPDEVTYIENSFYNNLIYQHLDEDDENYYCYFKDREWTIDWEKEYCYSSLINEEGDLIEEYLLDEPFLSSIPFLEDGEDYEDNYNFTVDNEGNLKASTAYFGMTNDANAQFEIGTDNHPNEFYSKIDNQEDMIDVPSLDCTFVLSFDVSNLSEDITKYEKTFNLEDFYYDYSLIDSSSIDTSQTISFESNPSITGEELVGKVSLENKQIKVSLEIGYFSSLAASYDTTITDENFTFEITIKNIKILNLQQIVLNYQEAIFGPTQIKNQYFSSSAEGVSFNYFNSEDLFKICSVTGSSYIKKNVYGNSNHISLKNITDSGYLPVSIAGWDMSKTSGSYYSYTNFQGLNIYYDNDEKEYKLFVETRNGSGNAIKVSFTIKIFCIKMNTNLLQ